MARLRRRGTGCPPGRPSRSAPFGAGDTAVTDTARTPTLRLVTASGDQGHPAVHTVLLTRLPSTTEGVLRDSDALLVSPLRALLCDHLADTTSDRTGGRHG
jgi:hypothetical protein